MELSWSFVRKKQQEGRREERIKRVQLDEEREGKGEETKERKGRKEKKIQNRCSKHCSREENGGEEWDRLECRRGRKDKEREEEGRYSRRNNKRKKQQEERASV